jgi:hypothetical protein
MVTPMITLYFCSFVNRRGFYIYKFTSIYIEKFVNVKTARPYVSIYFISLYKLHITRAHLYIFYIGINVLQNVT